MTAPLTAPAPGTIADPFVGSAAASELVWSRLRRPYDAVDAVVAAFGAPRESVRQLAVLLVAAGPEATELLSDLDGLARGLANTTGKAAERCRGEVRGPIMWSETLSARASSFGADDVFVCSAPYREYDVPENRVLREALRRIAEAGERVEHMPSPVKDGPVGRRALEHAGIARRFLGHRALEQVRSKRPSARDRARVRRTRASRHYRTALSVLERHDQPMTVDDVLVHADRRTRVQHGLLAGLITGLEQAGVRLPDLEIVDGALVAGPLLYRHPQCTRFDGDLHGVLVGDLLVDVPVRVRDRDPIVAQTALERRAAGRPCIAVVDAAGIDRAVATALCLGVARTA